MITNKLEFVNLYIGAVFWYEFAVIGIHNASYQTSALQTKRREGEIISVIKTR